ncbi:hypothetical protein CDD82_7347 [Ophiocordyceps australis]|uniref:Uncharacterized protein n=1 Tax=Ophiocordyceps australis TaxID=1399860 RepID=A0A2C5YRD8_9HYPO|nr:hypothetical protein CDD82_7347 [Ophiocordyceps australis]
MQDLSQEGSNMTSGAEESLGQSSAFLTRVVETTTVSDQENASAVKASRHSRVISRTELSPLRIVEEQQRSGGRSESPTGRSPRKLWPEKRFPVKISCAATEESRRMVAQTVERDVCLEEALKQNEGLKHAIEIFEDEHSLFESGLQENKEQRAVVEEEGAQDANSEADDTIASAFSTFSAVPNMSMFAKLGHKSEASPSRTEERGNTSNLLDFTEQLRFPQASPSKRGGSVSPMRSAVARSTPSRQLLHNLMDLEMPPLPTPRSVPSITARELESLKSDFLSQISSLKASLSGKEAEVQSLKSAVGDAEKRVGESLEQVREERAAKEQLAGEKEEWERRGRDLEGLLCRARDEVGLAQREHEEMEQKLEESEKRREAAEMLHQEAESKIAGMRAGSSKEALATSPTKTPSPTARPDSKTASKTAHDVEVAVERVARELHALYKGKHETKVAALKKSYGERWEKRVGQLQAQVDDLVAERDRLRCQANATAADRATAADEEEQQRRAQAAHDSAAMKQLEAQVQRLQAEAREMGRTADDLRATLDRERVEKGEIMQLAEELISMQTAATHHDGNHRPSPAKQQHQQHQQQASEPPAAKTPRQLPSNRVSGLRAPTSGLRPPRGGAAGGLPRPGGGATRSSLMSSIEKMGNHRYRG